MVKHKTLTLDKFRAIRTILDEIKDVGNLKGVILSYRDGALIAENVGESFNYKEFAAMCASVLESAEGLGKTIGINTVDKIITELDEQTIIIIECDQKLFFSFIIDNASNMELIFNKIKDYSERIINQI